MNISEHDWTNGEIKALRLLTRLQTEFSDDPYNSREFEILDDSKFRLNPTNYNKLIDLAGFFSDKAYTFGGNENEIIAIPHKRYGVFKIKIKELMLFPADIQRFTELIKSSTVLGFLKDTDGRLLFNCYIPDVHVLRENEKDGEQANDNK